MAQFPRLVSRSLPPSPLMFLPYTPTPRNLFLVSFSCIQSHSFHKLRYLTAHVSPARLLPQQALRLLLGPVCPPHDWAHRLG